MNDREDVVLVNQSTGYLMVDIVNAYACRYTHVTLIAGRIQEGERKLDAKVKIDRIIPYNKRSSFKRIYTWLFGTFCIFLKLLFKYRGYKIVYVTNPPMSYLLSLVLKNKFSIIVYDIYPEALRNIGIKETNVFYRLWGRFNRKLFHRADNIYTLSKGMRNELAKYVESSKIKVVYNWAASEHFKPIPRVENRFVIENNLTNKFIVLYSGNMGYTHNVEAIIEVANELKDFEDICFLLIGEGKKKNFLQEKVVEYGLDNCKFMTWQPNEILPYSLAAADVGVVTLNDETATVSVPSKTYNLLAVGAPLLCIAPQRSELNGLIATYNNGRCFDKDDVAGMADFVMRLYNDSDYKNRLSRNSVKASKDFTYKNAMQYV